MRPRGIILIAALLLIPAQGYAAPINQMDYFSLTGSEFIDFESLPGGAAPGVNNDGIIALIGASFAERFVGQALSFSGNSDILSGSPTGPLALQVGDPNDNLGSYTRSPDGVVLYGLGPLGFPNFAAIGEGAIAILFDRDQSEFGFQSMGGNAGEAFFSFFRRDGTLIHTITPTNLGSDYFGFSREGGVKDIAGISIHNTDPAGIGFDDIKFDVPGVPEPSTIVLLGSGLLGLVAYRRRRKS